MQNTPAARTTARPAPSATAQPLIRTDRLLLRPFAFADAPEVQRLAGAYEIADTTISVPHPYQLNDAIDWIEKQPRDFAAGRAVRFAIRLLPKETLIGAIELHDIDREHAQAELGYWIDQQRWGKGYATEAGTPVVRYGFDVLGLNRIYAHHLVRNVASGEVLRKLGMRQEGVLRQRVRKWGRFEDVVLCAVLRRDLDL
jgi:[ribosomal protein S5]-alanine N-acetyltransferase